MKIVLAIVLASLVTACGGGDIEPDDPPRSVSCAERPVACR